MKGALARGPAGLADVVQVLGDADILVLSETWLAVGAAPPTLQGYRSLSWPRPARLRHGPARVGLACYAKDAIFPSLTVINVNTSGSIVELRMVTGSDTARALTLVCAYIPPCGSTAVDLQRLDVWGVLRELVSGAMLSSDVMILGDLNARTGTLPDFVSGCPTSFHGPPPVGTPRRSKDVVSSGCVNAHGRALSALCRGTGMRIVNGRTSGDQHGEFTFQSMQGPSVIDYVVACPSLMGAIALFA